MGRAFSRIAKRSGGSIPATVRTARGGYCTVNAMAHQGQVGNEGCGTVVVRLGRRMGVTQVAA